MKNLIVRKVKPEDAKALSELAKPMQFNHKSGKHIQVDDARIYIEEIGDKSKPVLLLLHGGMNTLEVFNPLLKELPQDFPYRIIGLDSRGHGMC